MKDQKPVIPGRVTMPPVRLTDPAFVYFPSYRTDIKRTFEEARKRMGVKREQ